jgi:ankyrin repeat protein
MVPRDINDLFEVITNEELPNPERNEQERKTISLINEGEDLNISTALDPTPLIKAIKQGYTEIAKQLLESKADPDKVGGKNLSTPLIEAVKNNQPSVVKVLLNAKANLYKANQELTPLSSATI